MGSSPPSRPLSEKRQAAVYASVERALNKATEQIEREHRRAREAAAQAARKVEAELAAAAAPAPPQDVFGRWARAGCCSPDRPKRRCHRPVDPGESIDGLARAKRSTSSALT